MARPKARSTSIIAAIVLALGGLGFLLAGASLLASLATRRGTMEPWVLSGNAALSTLSKIWLIGTGLALLFRFPKVHTVATVGLVASLADSAFYFSIVLPRMLSTKSGAAAVGVAFGAALPMLASLLGYIAILLYVRSPQHRAEFSRAELSPGAP